MNANTCSLSAVADDAEVYGLDATYGATGSTATYRELEAASLIIVVGEDPTARNPVAGARLRRAIRNGAQILSLVSSSSPIRWLAQTHLQVHPGSHSLVLGWLVKELLGMTELAPSAEQAVVRQSLADCTQRRVESDTGIPEALLRQALEQIQSASGPIVVVYPIDNIHERSPDCPVLMAQLLELVRPASPGSGLLFTQSGANLLGLKIAGLLPSTREEYISLVETLNRQEIKGAWIVREDPLVHPSLAHALRTLQFLVVQGTFMTETAQKANVVFPASTHLETGGTFVRSDGLILSAPPCLPTVAPVSTTQLLQDACLQLQLVPSQTSAPSLLQESFARCSGTFHVRHHFRWIPSRPAVDQSPGDRPTVSSARHFIRSRLPVKV